MPQVSLRDQLRRLVELQKIDKEAFDYRQELKDKPIQLVQLEEEFERQKAGLKSLEEKSKALQVERKNKELDLKSKEGEITKANTQLMQIKTNKEYTAKLTEIENLKADKSIMEEKILLLYDEMDTLTEKINKEKRFLTEQEKKFLSQKKEIEEAIKDLEAKVKTLEGQRLQQLPDADKDILARYERILERKNGVAIVPVQGDVCGGCFMNVPSQVINEIKMHDRLIVCEMCARILYLEDDL